MEKVRFGLIGIGAQGGAYAGFLTGQGGFPGIPAELANGDDQILPGDHDHLMDQLFFFERYYYS